VREMNTEVAQLLLQYNAQVNLKGPNGYTPLHLAIINNDEEMVQVLLSMPGIDVNITSDTSKTALHLASERGLAAIASELLVSNARTDILDVNGRTALLVAQQRQKQDTTEVIQAFIESRNAAQQAAPAAGQQQAADQAAQDADNACPICMIDFAQDEGYTPCCLQKIHGPCLTQWTNTGNNTCPLCRAHLG